MDLCNIKTVVTVNVKTSVYMSRAETRHSTPDSSPFRGLCTRNYSIKNWWPTAILTLILLLLPSLVFSASSRTKQGSKEDRWFEVELIVFAHKNGHALESEKWPEITDLVLPEKMIELGQPVDKPPEKPKVKEQSLIFEQVNPANSSNEEPIPMPVAFVMLKDEELQLKDSFKKLSRSSKFDPLLHVAWRQPTYGKKRAQPVLLYEGMTDPDFDNTRAGSRKKSKKAKKNAGAQTINPRFSGTIRLSVARYLHFAADLIYRMPVTQRVAIPVPSDNLWNDTPYQTLYDPQGPAFQLDSWKAMRGFNLKESRRMRSKRIHYLDHPFMGIVVLITPVELPKNPEELSADNP